MRLHLVIISAIACPVLVVAVFAIGCRQVAPPPAAERALSGALRVDFAAMPVDAPPAGFTATASGPGRPPRFMIRALASTATQAAPGASAPAGRHVLVQEDDDPTNHRYAVALLRDSHLGDVAVSVLARALRGERDRSFGVAARAIDPGTYYLLRANTADVSRNVRLYRFVHGVRSELASVDLDIAPEIWHTLRLEIRGDRLVGFLDGAEVIRARDIVLPGAGMIGVWTKAESVSEFADLNAEPL